MMSVDGLHVVLGGSGGVGSALVRELVARGRRVRAVTRSGTAGAPEGVEEMARDVSRPQQAEEACDGASVVYHCANVPYAEWPSRFPPLTASIVEGTGRAGARLVFADNLYMYGPVAGPISESLPYHAPGRKGVTRARTAEDVMEAHAAGVVEVAIGRAPDFYGPRVTRSMMGEEVFGRAVQGRGPRLVGRLDLPHSHAYVEDFAWALATLGERDESWGEIWHVPSAPPTTTGELLEILFDVLGKRLPTRTMGRLGLSLFGVFNPMLRELKEILYQFDAPFVVDHGKFERVFGARVTPHREAIEATVAWYRDRPG